MAASDGKAADKLTQELGRKAKALAELRLPQGSEHYYHHSTSETYRQAVATLKQEAVKLIGSCQELTKGALPGPWADQDDAQEAVTTCLDELLTLVDTALDRHKKGDPVQAIPSATFTSLTASNTTGAGLSAAWTTVQPSSGKKHLGHASGIPKPQEKFSPKVDNGSAPFIHWAPHLEGIGVQPPSLRQLDEPKPQHPLQPQLDSLVYPEWQLEAPEPIAPRPLEETPLHWVDTPEALQHMVQRLFEATHIAIDLENHSFRSFQGFTCLMQLSTRDEDWLVDTLALRAHLGPALAKLFADPAVVKVLHGSDHDVLWLQRDFHLYLVNTFDTGQAARVLCLASAGLAHLLEHYCGVTADKRFQLADWRVRPLSPDMLHYARVDTHYLLYVYDRLKQQLLELGEQVPPSLEVPLPPGLITTPTQTALATVLERSKRICGSLYAKDVVDADSIEQQILKWQLNLAPVQRAVLHALMLWRDKVAREEDEGTGYVLPKVPLVALAKNIPGSAAEVLRMASQSHNNVPEPVKRRLNEVVTCILGAKAAALNPRKAPAATPAAPVVPVAVTDPATAAGGNAPNSWGLSLQPSAVPRIQRKAAGNKTVSEVGDAGGVPVQPTLTPLSAVELLTMPAGGAAMQSGSEQHSIQLSAVPIPAPIVRKKSKGSAFAAALTRKPVPAPAVIISGDGEQQDAAATKAAAAEVRNTFALPFSLQATAGAGSSVAGEQDQQGGAATEVQPSGDQMETDAVATSGADVRALVDAMRAAGPGTDIVIGADGQRVADSDTAAAAEQQGQTGGADGAAADDDEEEGGVDVHKGQDVGLPLMDFVPMSLNELKRMRKPGDGGGTRGKKRGKQQGDDEQGSKRVKVKQYTTELKQQQAAEVAQQQEKQIRSLFGEDEEEGSESESEEEVGEKLPVSREMLRRPVQQDGRRGGKQGGRGRGAPAKGQQKARGGGKPGDRKPAFNPYDIPEDNLIKGGKRSAVMPRSGNRTATFRNK